MSPVTWNNGASPRITSCDVSPIHSSYTDVANTTLRCVFIAPFGVTGRARRVHHECDVVAGQVDRPRPLAGVPSDDLEHVRRLGLTIPRNAGEHRRQRAVRVQELERRRRDGVPHGRRGQRRPRDIRVEILLANHRQTAGAAQNLAELAIAQHRVARHDDRAALPNRQYREHDLRNVLQIDGNTIARFDAALLQADRERIGHRVALGRRERAVEVVNQRRVGAARERGTEHGERRLAARRELGAHTSVEIQPGTLRNVLQCQSLILSLLLIAWLSSCMNRP